MKLRASGRSDVGRKRSQNQDQLAAVDGLSLYVVADGMGGHSGGEIASKIAAETIVAFLEKARTQKTFSEQESVSDAIRKANAAIFKKAQQDAGLHGMGTTNLVRNGRHAGDSLLSTARDLSSRSLPRDHSLVQEKPRRADHARADQIRSR